MEIFKAVDGNFYVRFRWFFRSYDTVRDARGGEAPRAQTGSVREKPSSRCHRFRLRNPKTGCSSSRGAFHVCRRRLGSLHISSGGMKPHHINPE